MKGMKSSFSCLRVLIEGMKSSFSCLRVLIEGTESSFPFLGVYTYAKSFKVFIYNRFPNVYICQL